MSPARDRERARPRSWRGWAILGAAAAGLVALVLALRGAEAPARAPPCRTISFEASLFTVCELDLGQDEFRLVWEGADGAPLRSFAALQDRLGPDAARVRFGMNAGMFDPAGAPIGLYVEAGEERHAVSTTEGPGNFHLMPNGVFSIDHDGLARVEPTPVFRARGGAPYWATQSGPMLVINNALHPAFSDDGPSRLVRNGVGTRDGKRVIFAISETPVSFGRFARLFRDALACPNALYLDGTVSALWAPSLNRRDSNATLGPLVVVLARD